MGDGISRLQRMMWERIHRSAGFTLVVALFLIGLPVSIAPAVTEAAGAASTLSPNPAPVISRGVPAYGTSNGYPASWANDADYSTVWNSVSTPSTSSPVSLTYDLSGVPAANRGTVLYAWYNDETGNYIQPDGYYGMPQDYTIQANPAAGGALPGTGWVTLVTVTGNTYSKREYVLNLSGYNWVRIRITASRGGSPAIQADVHDLSQGNQDDWLFLGDSITMEAFNHHNIDGSAWVGGNYSELVHASEPAYFPAVIDGGVGGTTMQWGYNNRATLLQNFTGQYVAIAFGTNDANTSGALDSATVNAWYSNLLGLVDYVISQGKTPVVGKIPWGSASGGWLATNARTLNTKIDQLYVDRPGVVHGPDLYSFFASHQNLIRDGIHPTYDQSQTAGTYQGYVGYEWLQRLWRDAMVANVYNGAPTSAPAVTLSPTSLTFPNQTVSTTSSAQTVTLTNSGNADLALSSIALTGPNAGDFAQSNTCPSTLAAGASCTISLTFTPSATGTRTASLTLSDNASGSPQSLSVTGTGVTAPAPGVRLSPTSLTFASQLTNTSSAAQTVTLTNSGTAALTLTSIGLTGTNAGDFAQTNSCPLSPATLAAGANCTLSVTFTPTATGSRSASLTISDDATGSPQSVTLSGTGSTPAPAVSLSPTSLSFGNQLDGTTSAAQTVTLTNSGTTGLSITSIGIAGTNASDFAQTNTCPSTVAAGANCTISVTFTPSSATSESASLTLTDNAADSPQSVALSGTGTTPAPAVSLSPSSLSFGNQLVSTSSAAQTVTLTNSGTAPLTISSIGTTGTNASDFSQTNTCPLSPATLSAGANCTINVTFSPTATGSRTASLTISDTASGSPQTVAVSGSGTAPAVSLSPTSVTFASQQLSTTSSPQTLTLTNSGTAPLTISSIGITGTNASDFAQTNTCPASPSTLAVGAKCTISLTFTPTATGTRTASLAISDNAAGSPQTVSLSGTGSTTSNVLFSDGFESGSLPGAWTKTTISSGNSLTLDSGVVHSGTASLKAVAVKGKAGNAKISKTLTGQTTLDVRAYYLLSTPVNWGNVPIMSLYAQGNFIGWLAYYADPSAPTLSIYNGANGASYSCSVPSLNDWHSIELQYVLSTSTTGSVTVWIDGVKACGASAIKTAPASGLTINQVVVGIDGADNSVGLTVHVDDVVVSKGYIGP